MTDIVRPERTGPMGATARREALKRVNRRRVRWLGDGMLVVVAAVALFLLTKSFLIEAYKIPTGSMERTLLVGDFLLVDKLVYGAEVPFLHTRLPAVRHPRRGDVIVFEYPEDRSKNFVKRLVGAPGDTLAMTDGVLFLNGRAQREQYVSHTDPDFDPSEQQFRWQNRWLVQTAEAARTGYHPSRNNWGPLIVPVESYFVLGDNRDNSLDSRYWGFVPDSLVRGRPLLVYWSYAPDSASPFAFLSAVRGERVGRVVR
jgi:signal peptidase I